MIRARPDSAARAEGRVILSVALLLAVLAAGLLTSLGQARMSPALQHLLSTFVN